MKSATVSNFEQEPLTLLEWVEGGEEVTILRDGVPVARVTPVAVASIPVKSGKPSSPEEILRYLRMKSPPQGTFSSLTGTELVSLGRGAR